MRLAFRSARRPLRVALTATACASLGIGAALSGACFTAVPPDLPQLPLQRPTILHSSVVPPDDAILTELPQFGEFLVPVQLNGPSESFEWRVFIDYDPVDNRSFAAEGQGGGAEDGGVFFVSFTLSPTDLDPTLCHTIQFLVGHSFDPRGPHTFDSVGGDIVSWIYNAGGGPNGCPEYDAGALQDGAFPDAPSDGLPVLPTEAGGGG